MLKRIIIAVLLFLLAIPSVNAQNSCEPCNYSLTQGKGVMGYLYSLACLILNTIICNPILLGIFVFAMVIIYVFFKMRKKWGF
jgi:hypothetical protein